MAELLENPWLRTLLLQDHNTRVVVLATTLLGLAAGAVGSFTLLRRRALMGDALSHAMLPGIGLAFLLAPPLGLDGKSLPVLLAGAATSGALGTLAILFIRHQTRLGEDAALGIVLSVFFGAGLAILGLVQQASDGHAAGLESFILGKTASITTTDAFWIMVCGAVAVGILAVGFKELTLLCFDPGYTAARGYPALGLDIALMGAVVLITVVGLQAVGLILMIALLVIPAATARFWVTQVRSLTILSALIGAVSCMTGALLSALAPDLPSGATIVLAAASLFFISLLFGPQRGFLIRVLDRRATRRRTDRQHVLRGVYELLEARSPQQDLAAEPTTAPMGAAQDAGTVPIQELLALRSWSPVRMLRELRRCQREGLLNLRGDTLTLTGAGWEQASRATREHRLWELYLIAHADVAPGRVDRDAEQIEHILEPEMIRELEALLPKSPDDRHVPGSPHRLPSATGSGAAAATGPQLASSPAHPSRSGPR